MKRYWLSAAVFFLTSTICSAGWEIQELSSQGRPTGCFMAANYTDGTRLGIVVFNNYDYALSLLNPSWRLRKGGKLKITAFVDGARISHGQARVVEGMAVLPLVGSQTFEALQKGYSLVLFTPQGRLSFSLRGTSGAMDDVLRCTARTSRLAEAATSAERADDLPYRSLTGSQNAAFLAKVLQDSPATDYTIQPIKSENDFAVVSLADGSIGMLSGFIGKTPSADEAAAQWISSSTKNCAGEFLSGKQSVPSTDGSMIRKVATTCRHNGIAISDEVTIVRKSGGLLVTFSVVRKEQAGGDAAPDARTGQPSFMDAVMQVEAPN